MSRFGARMTAWRAAGVYSDRRVLSLFFFGFASGLPLALTGATLAAWLTQAGTALGTIGFAALVGFAYNLKFLWSPIVDRVPLPFLTRWLGLRRGWMLCSQILLIVAILGMAGTDPSAPGGLWWTVFWAVMVAFASATQDIVIDAYRTEILEPAKLGAGAATLTFGYRIAMLVSGGGALIVAGVAGWGWAYSAMAALVLVGIVTVMVNPEPAATAMHSDKEEGRSSSRWQAWFRKSVIDPFSEFASRTHWPVILLFVLLFKSGDALIGHMATTFYLKIGFSLIEIGVVSKGYGLAMTLIGAVVGGMLVARFGILKTLLATGVLQALSNLVFIVQAEVGYSVPMLTVTIGTENFSGGMGTTAFVAYLSSLCNLSFTATQYALLSSLFAQSRTVFSAGSGWIVERIDWVPFFYLTAAVAVPGLLLLLYLMAKTGSAEADRLVPTENTR
jgi:MFS transporter, PAT family, beta-lactamase induction signal transducer AmpG